MEFHSTFNSIYVYPHHNKQNICGSRAKYRDGKKETAVKVYTINQESVYILISNVPAVGGSEELRALCDQYGIVDEFQALDDYPCEEFTEVYLVKFNSFPSARTAKKYLDDKSFFGGTLHVFYAPEFESVIETSIKLQERRKYVAWRSKKGQNPVPRNKLSIPQSGNSKSTKPSVAERNLAAQPVTYVWAGREYTVYPNAPAVQEPVTDKTEKKMSSSSRFVPRQLQQKSSDGATCSSYNYEAQGTGPSNLNFSHVDETSYLNTVAHVRTKISNVSVPNVRMSKKKEKEEFKNVFKHFICFSPLDQIISILFLSIMLLFLLNKGPLSYITVENIDNMINADLIVYSCKICNYIAKSEKSLKIHENVHLQDTPLKCPHCLKPFSNRQSLTSHLYTHDAGRHFTCSICGKSFRHSSSLFRHKRSHRM